jgi:Family of unknown function (DUF5684)
MIKMLENKPLKIGLQYGILYIILIIINTSIDHYFQLSNFELVKNNTSMFLSIYIYYSYILAFITLLALAFSKYRRIDIRYTFKGFLILTFVFILFTYISQYLVSYAFYFFTFKEAVIPKSETGILSLLDAFTGYPREPTFSPFTTLIVSPIRSLWDLLVNRDLYGFQSFSSSKMYLVSLVLYFEALYLLFKANKLNPKHALFPVTSQLGLLSISKKPWWLIFFLIFPIIRLFPLFFMNQPIAKHYGKNTLYAFGLTILPSIFLGYLSLNAENEIDR